ncbi:MAG: TonB-dependent receptor [Bryobacteraceae bacterium]
MRSALTTCFALALLLARVEFAQTATAQISGRVSDPSGAAVPGAEIKLTSLSTGFERGTESNIEGFYSIPLLQPGAYRMTVLKEGFRPAARSEIHLDVDEELTVNFNLNLGAVAQNVDVRSAGDLVSIETNSATLGQVEHERQIRDLPLNGRNFTQLLMLSPGTAAPQKISDSWGNPQVGEFVMPSLNGQSTKSTMWLLDGANNSSPGFALVSISPVIDDIVEFKVQSHTDSAEYGGVLGGVVNVVTRGGTNEFHGAAWEFLRNDRMDARNFFQSKVTPLRQNQFGGNIGGPAVLPHLYNGHNRTFFFASYQGFRQRLANSTLYRVPTPEEMRGNFQGESPIFDPFGNRPDPARPGDFLRNPFPGNMIPSSLIDPAATAHIAATYPAPVNTGFTGMNGMNLTPNVTDQDIWTLRGDHQMNRDFFSARYTGINTPVTTAGDGGLAGSTFRRQAYGYGAMLNYTRALSSNTLLHALFSRSYIDLRLTSKMNGINESSLVPRLYASDFACGFIGGFGADKCYLPYLQIPGFAGVNEFQARVGQTDIWEMRPDISWIHGGHELKAGFSYAQHRIWAVTQRAFVGFDTRQTADLENPGSTGNALASFLLGVPANAERADAPDSMVPARLYGMFWQDRWKVSGRLTLSFGLRYDIDILPSFGDPSFFHPPVQNQYSGEMDLMRGVYLLPAVPPACQSTGQAPCMPTPDGSLPPHVVLARNGKLFHNIYDNWQPRLGLAYRLQKNLVVRAGAGRFFDIWNETTLAAAQSEGQWPDNRDVVQRLLNQTFVTTRLSDPLGSPGRLPAATPFDSSATSRDPYMKNPLSNQWNAGLEWQISGSTALSANYVGSQGRRIPVGGYYNTAVTPGPGDPALRRPYPYMPSAPFIRDWGRSWYDALQLSVRRQISRSIAYSVAYTWSKTLDLATSDGFAGGPQNPYDLWNDKGPASFDLPQVLAASFIFEIPAPRGADGVVHQALRGWQVDWLAQWSSGRPYSVFACGDVANIGLSGCYSRANLAGNPTPAHPGIQEWFNPASFAVPALYSFGDLGRNRLRGPAYSNIDLALFRDFSIREKARLQFRGEAFNLPNHTSFAEPIANLNDINVGRIFATRSIERQIQLGLKLYF